MTRKECQGVQKPRCILDQVFNRAAPNKDLEMPVEDPRRRYAANLQGRGRQRLALPNAVADREEPRAGAGLRSPRRGRRSSRGVLETQDRGDRPTRAEPAAELSDAGARLAGAPFRSSLRIAEH